MRVAGISWGVMWKDADFEQGSKPVALKQCHGQVAWVKDGYIWSSILFHRTRAIQTIIYIIGNRQIPIDWWTSGKNYSIQFFLTSWLYIYVSDPVKSCYIILNHHVWFWNPPFWSGHIWLLPSGQAVADGLKNVAQHHIRSEAGTGHGSQLILWFHTCMCIHTPN